MQRLISLGKYGKAVVALCALGLSSGAVRAQVTGGVHAFEFLRMSNSAHVSALGGMSVSNPDNDIALALQNPALMRPGLHNNLELTYNGLPAGISVMNLQYGYHVPKLNTSFMLGVQYLNYGSFTQTDALGNDLGQARATDYAITLGASRQYGEHWRYGASLKWANSNYNGVTAMGVVADVGINYYDTSKLWDVGIVAKNMGVMVKKYTPNLPTEPMPFDLQIGVSKRFKHLPLRLFTTLHHLYEWDIRYDNPEDRTTSGFSTNDTIQPDKSGHFGDKLFRHFIFGAELTFAKRVTITASYNNLRRRDMALSTSPGMAGFAFGLGLSLNKFQVHYARSYYHIAGPYNELSLTLALNRLFGMGKGGERIHWSDVYEDW